MWVNSFPSARLYDNIWKHFLFESQTEEKCKDRKTEKWNILSRYERNHKRWKCDECFLSVCLSVCLSVRDADSETVTDNCLHVLLWQ